MVFAPRDRYRLRCATAPHVLPALYGLERTQTSPSRIAWCSDAVSVLSARLRITRQKIACNPLYTARRAKISSAFQKQHPPRFEASATRRCGTLACRGAGSRSLHLTEIYGRLEAD